MTRRTATQTAQRMSASSTSGGGRQGTNCKSAVHHPPPPPPCSVHSMCPARAVCRCLCEASHGFRMPHAHTCTMQLLVSLTQRSMRFSHTHRCLQVLTPPPLSVPFFTLPLAVWIWCSALGLRGPPAPSTRTWWQQCRRWQLPSTNGASCQPWTLCVADAQVGGEPTAAVGPAAVLAVIWWPLNTANTAGTRPQPARNSRRPRQGTRSL